MLMSCVESQCVSSPLVARFESGSGYLVLRRPRERMSKVGALVMIRHPRKLGTSFDGNNVYLQIFSVPGINDPWKRYLTYARIVHRWPMQ